MPDRPFALGLLQALSAAVGNITAALNHMSWPTSPYSRSDRKYWRYMFVVGTVPAVWSSSSCVA